MKATWIESRHVLAVMSIGLLTASTAAHAELDSQTQLLFHDSAAPLKLILVLGIWVGFLEFIMPCVAVLLDVSARFVGLQSMPRGNRGLHRLITVSLYLLVGLLSAAFISKQISTTAVSTVLDYETWAVVVLGVFLILSALSLFGLYRIRIPNLLSGRYRDGQSPSVSFRLMLLVAYGLLPVLVFLAIFSPLVLPMSVLLESMMIFAVAVILVLVWSALSVTVRDKVVSIFTLLPAQTSDWKHHTRCLLGVLPLAAVIHLLGMIPDVPVLLLWGLLLVVTAVYLGATQRNASTANSSNRLMKGAGIAVMVWGGVVLVGASAGNRDITDPLPQLSTIIAGGGLTDSNGISNTNSKVFTYITSADEFEQMLSTAKSDNRPVLLDFYADWCLDCKRMDRTTFKDPTVVARLKDDFLALKIDVSDPDDSFGRDTRKRFGVFGPPALVLFDGQGNHLEDLIAYGYLNTNELLQLLSKVPASSPGAS